jgi:hypothetical protein
MFEKKGSEKTRVATLSLEHYIGTGNTFFIGSKNYHFQMQFAIHKQNMYALFISSHKLIKS